MCSGDKVFLILVTLTWDLGMAEAEAVKRDLIGHHPGLEFLQLGTFGPVSGLPGHPALAHLGLAPRQTLGFLDALLRAGLLAPHALRHADGRPVALGPRGPLLQPLPLPGFLLDPYFLYLLARHERYLPFGLGPQGIYGSTGLPKPPPLGVFKYGDKN